MEMSQFLPSESWLHFHVPVHPLVCIVPQNHLMPGLFIFKCVTFLSNYSEWVDGLASSIWNMLIVVASAKSFQEKKDQFWIKSTVNEGVKHDHEVVLIIQECESSISESLNIWENWFLAVYREKIKLKIPLQAVC